MGTCIIYGCDGTTIARELCALHYKRWFRTGDAGEAAKLRHPGLPAAERFWTMVRKTPSCWLWTGSKRTGGYGQFLNDKGKLVGAHRFAYELLIGPIKPGMHLDHLCSTPACVNPAHLEPVTRKENILRGNGFGGLNARKTHCPKGHPYDAENTRWENGWRRCRACDAEKSKARREARRKTTTIAPGEGET